MSRYGGHRLLMLSMLVFAGLASPPVTFTHARSVSLPARCGHILVPFVFGHHNLLQKPCSITSPYIGTLPSHATFLCADASAGPAADVTGTS